MKWVNATTFTLLAGRVRRLCPVSPTKEKKRRCWKSRSIPVPRRPSPPQPLARRLRALHPSPRTFASGAVVRPSEQTRLSPALPRRRRLRGERGKAAALYFEANRRRRDEIPPVVWFASSKPSRNAGVRREKRGERGRCARPASLGEPRGCLPRPGAQGNGTRE